ncbi:hypothetical protein EUQ28_15995 [Salmonella enterica subsp. enterica serovar Millesi]|uniref:hypothetical protein n=1 Tax=Salmonella enterica TaxID=28901 RepID=UPI0012E4D216|nr:hypothetical protein [Salmonella enterica]EBS6311400.1 hypothetical protein [Salmonella enterica subsp. enterica serovar Millesi]EBW7631718.1 hypothetical protein [Salmonella enterica subsp. enterica serovar Millesi]ECA5751879.1 hypothetical protein [Salmonella enterica subsp. enterica serovar Millesi]ECA9832749.1 hypothetical protein [Salmonella enterica subsp. enterica serovar Millesi]EGG4117006.1 hypothetical protein [Salmonella enterica]
MIPFGKVESLAACRMNEQQIADVLDINLPELKTDSAQLMRYREAIRKGRAKGEAELRSVLYKRAKGGDRSAYTELMRREKESS